MDASYPSGATGEQVENYIDVLKKEAIYGAVIGTSGVGKSTLVNTLRGLQYHARQPFYDPEASPCDHTSCGGHPEPALTSSEEGTFCCTPYRNPYSPNVIIWDVPGVGSATFKRKDYFDLIKLERFHFVIIVSAGRFREDDVLIAEECVRLNKPFFFVRSKIDQDVMADKESGYTVPETLSRVRSACEKNLPEGKAVYLISGKLNQCDNYDYHKLTVDISLGLEQIKREALLLSTQGFSKELIEAKKAVMERRARQYSVMSAGIATVPFPGVSLVADISMITAMSIEAHLMYGLDEGHLRQVALVGSAATLKPALEEVIKSVGTYVGRDAIIKLLTKYAAAATVEEVARYIPVMGTVLAAGISGTTTFLVCSAINQGLYENACAMADIIMKRQILLEEDMARDHQA